MNFLFKLISSMGFEPEGIKKYFANTSWLIVERVMRLMLAFLTTILIVRYLGPEKFGLYSYSISIVSLIAVLAYAGLENILTRELVKYPEKTLELLGTGFVLRFMGAVLIIVVLLIIGIAAKEPQLNFLMILIIGTANIFQPFGVIDFYFQSKVQVKYSVIVQSSSFFLLTIARIAAIILQAHVIVFAILIAVEALVCAIGYVIVYSSEGNKILKWKYNHLIAKQFLNDSWPLILSGLAVSTFAKIDQVLLKFLVNEEGVGFYSAAVRIVEAWYFIPMAITTSIFPAILNAKQTNEAEYQRRLKKLYDLMAAISIGIALIITLLSGFIIHLFYGEKFVSSTPVLTIYIWSGIATFLGVASNQFLIAENLTKLSLYRSVFGMIANILLNFLLIPIYGINGAALATLISYFISTFFIGLFKETKEQAFLMIRSVFLISTIKFVSKFVFTRKQ
ncbi:MAG: flippase [Ignavibacteriaceae bacterium]|nr:flippase [Ignavibacteriaceae bacterium]